MRTTDWKRTLSATLLAGLIIAQGTATAAPIPYRINFTTEVGLAPDTGSFLYDAGLVGAITIEWNDAIFTPQQLTLGSACGSPQDSTTPAVISAAVLGQNIGPCSRMSRWRAEYDGRPGGQLLFVLENQTGNDDYYVAMSSRRTPGANSDQRGLGSGGFSVAPDVPEPGTAVLVLCGGLWLALRRRGRTA